MLVKDVKISLNDDSIVIISHQTTVILKNTDGIK